MLRVSQPLSGQKRRKRGLCCHFGTPHTLVIRHMFALLHAKSNYSRTSEAFSRKSNYSRTYAKQGGRGVYSFAFRSPFLCALCVLCGRCDPLFFLLAARLPRAISAKGHSPARRSFSGGGSLTPIIPAPLATAALRVVPAPTFTTTSSTHVGAPTIWSAAACRRFQG